MVVAGRWCGWCAGMAGGRHAKLSQGLAWVRHGNLPGQGPKPGVQRHMATSRGSKSITLLVRHQRIVSLRRMHRAWCRHATIATATTAGIRAFLLPPHAISPASITSWKGDLPISRTDLCPPLTNRNLKLPLDSLPPACLLMTWRPLGEPGQSTTCPGWQAVSCSLPWIS